MKVLSFIAILMSATLLASCMQKTATDNPSWAFFSGNISSGSIQSENTDTEEIEFFTYTNDEYGFSIDLPKMFETTTPKSTTFENGNTNLAFEFYSDEWNSIAPALTIAINPDAMWDEFIAECASEKSPYDMPCNVEDWHHSVIGKIPDYTVTYVYPQDSSEDMIPYREAFGEEYRRTDSRSANFIWYDLPSYLKIHFHTK